MTAAIPLPGQNLLQQRQRLPITPAPRHSPSSAHPASNGIHVRGNLAGAATLLDQARGSNAPSLGRLSVTISPISSSWGAISTAVLMMKAPWSRALSNTPMIASTGDEKVLLLLPKACRCRSRRGSGGRSETAAGHGSHFVFYLIGQSVVTTHLWMFIVSLFEVVFITTLELVSASTAAAFAYFFS